MKAYESIDDFVVESSDEVLICAMSCFFTLVCPEFNLVVVLHSSLFASLLQVWTDEVPSSDDQRKGKSAKNRKGKEKKKNKSAKPIGDAAGSEEKSWWGDLLNGIDVEDESLSGKMILLLFILKEAAKSKVKVFPLVVSALIVTCKLLFI